ncbi:MAG TPA: HAD-IA family hydrolase [Steroidobacteraceae bacterium]|nr:HAD-IA family hydrolase [Steroidobacteraceae bacterium]
MTSTTAIGNVVFDIGWVFVRLNYRPLLELLRSRGAEVADMGAVLARITLAEHESGRLHGRGLLEQLAGLTRAPVALEELHARWVDMFELEPAMVELAHRLSDQQRVYLLSNVGDLHWAHLSREYRLHRIGHGALPSYLAGVMKPHAGIYAEAERRFALAPAATVFIDDRPDNVAAARERGWHGIVHGGRDATVAALRELGVRC